ncbi:MAG: cyclase family protein [Frankia sp.]
MVELGTRQMGSAPFADAARRLSNWGRWGEDDQIGTLNLMSPGARAGAARRVASGSTLSLSLLLDASGPTSPQRGGPLHFMTATGSDTDGAALAGGARFTDDYIVMPLQCSTQWDGLAHIFYDDVLYNGVPSATVDSSGAARMGVEHAAGLIGGRAVLLDFVALNGGVVPRRGLITAADFDAMCERQGVIVQPGDILLVRTGSMAVWVETGSWREFRSQQSGLAFDCLDWLREQDVAAVAADNATVELAGYYSDYFVPLHMVGIRDMGLWLGEYWYLEGLAEACAADGRWDCFLSAHVLPVTGAVGSPVSAVALR